MTIYEIIKAAISVKQAAKHYGLNVNRNQALRLLKTCENIRLPRKFKAILEKYEHNPESLRAAGLAYAVDQIVDLVTNNVAGVHLYTMNNAATARHIHQATHALFKH